MKGLLHAIQVWGCWTQGPGLQIHELIWAMD